jgi:hypothetical protein
VAGNLAIVLGHVAFLLSMPGMEHTPPADADKSRTPEAPVEGGKITRLEATIYIELIVDGEIVDLNRIPLPSDTPIIHERFKAKESPTRPRSQRLQRLQRGRQRTWPESWPKELESS